MTLRIAFICSGNICRSPMAEALAEQMLDERGVPNVVISAGTLGLYGRPAAVNSRKAVADRSLDLEGHRSQGISAALLRNADYLVVMEPKHEKALRDLAPDLGEAIVRLWKYAPRDYDLSGIDDPVGQNIEAFRTCRDLIEACLENWFDEIL